MKGVLFMYLKGVLHYNDAHLGTVSYKVYAVDSSDWLRLLLFPLSETLSMDMIKSKILYDKKVVEGEDNKGIYLKEQNISVISEYEQGYDYRRLDIYKQSRKFKTNITNREFCTRVAGAIFYTLENGELQNNSDGLLSLDKGYFDISKTKKVEKEGFNSYIYSKWYIEELRLSNKFINMSLSVFEDDVDNSPIYQGVYFKELQQKDKFGNILSYTPIKTLVYGLDEDVLGIPYVSKITEDVNSSLVFMYNNMDEVIQAHPHKNGSWIKDRNYVIVDDDNLEEVINEFLQYDGYIAFDTETTGLNINFKSRVGEADQLVGVVLSKEVGTGYYFPLQHKYIKNLCGGDHFYFMERYMRPILTQKKIIGHNISFDWKVAYIYDINTNFVYDTMLALGVTKRYEDPDTSLSLKDSVKNFFGLDMWELSDFVYGGNFTNSGITFADLPYDLVKDYAPTDADMTLSLYYLFENMKLLDKYEARKVFDIEVNFAKVAGYSTFWGYRLNIDNVPIMLEETERIMKEEYQKMKELVGYDFNPNSPQQLVKIMFDELKIEVIGDKPSTDKKKVLIPLSKRTNADGSLKYPFVKYLLDYRDANKLFTGFLNKIDEYATKDGFIFADLRPLGTDTGRCSVKDPNYQSYNDVIKKNIIPRNEYIMFDCDFSQIEYRVLASLAKQQNLIEAFEDPDLDYHSYQASRMFNVPYSLVTKSLRQQSKGINFGLPYGMGDESLGAAIFGERSPENTSKARLLRRKFFEGQENIQEFFEKVRGEGVTKGFTKTYWGRRRYYNKSKFTSNEIRRQAGNHVIQGTAADIYKIACNRLWNRIVKEGWLGKVLFNAFVHDELVIEIHKSVDMFKFMKAWREEFQLEVEGFCKLYAGAGVGFSWYEAKKQDLPPQFIDRLINQVGKFEWDEDIYKFYNYVKEDYELFKYEKVRDYLLSEENQGEVIKPAIYSLLVEIVGKIAKERNDLPFIENGKVSCKSLDDYLTVFCSHYNIDKGKINIKDPNEVDITEESSDEDCNQESITDYNISILDMLAMNGYFLKEGVGLFLQNTMLPNGMDVYAFLKVNGYLKDVNMSSDDLKVYLLHFDNQIYDTEAYLSYNDYNVIISLYNSFKMSFVKVI